MASEWKETSIGALCDAGICAVQTGPFGSQLHSYDYVATGVPVVPIEAIRQRRIDTTNLPKIAASKAEELKRHRLYESDILFARRGAQATGEIAFVQQADAGSICGTGAILLRVIKRETLDPEYLSFVLADVSAKAWFRFHAIGATMPNLNEGIIRKFSFRLPPPAVQIAVRRALSCLDDKIELNRRMAATLEEMARALFKSWFVDFDPVRAKAEGRPTGLPAATAALFPDSFGEDGLPEGWQETPFGDAFDIRNGNTPSTEEPRYWDGEHHWATPKDLSPLASPVLLRTDRTLSDHGVAVVNSGLLPGGSLLLSTRAPIGYLAFASRPVAINQGMAGIVGKRLSTAFAWQWCAANIDTFLAVAGGSTFPEISKGTLRRLPMVVAPADVSSAFAACVDPIVERLVQLARENDHLVTLRDTLLPRLISGELRIKDGAARGEAA